MVRVKVCGLTRAEDALLAAELGASYLGFIFAPSKRRVSIAQVKNIMAELTAAGMRKQLLTVAVFVNETPAKMAEILEECEIDLAQIHGDETVEVISQFSFACYRALRVGSAQEFDKLAPHGGSEWPGHILLVDAAVEGVYGGSGKSVPLTAAQHACQKVKAAEKQFFLAGGLSPENIATIVNEVRPDGVDVSSGIESAPGIKDENKMRSFFEALR